MSLRVITCAGLRSAASTLQWQIATHLIEANGLGTGAVLNAGYDEATYQSDKMLALKTHLPSSGTIVTTTRDPRDVICSLMDRRDQPYEEALTDLVSYINSQSRSDGPLTYSARYEDFTHNLKQEVLNIAAFLGLPCSEKLASEIATTYSLEQNRKRLRDTHITDAAIGKYKDRLSPEQIKKVEKNTGDWMRKHGYTPFMTARGYLSDQERFWLMQRARGKKIIVNVGVQYGASLACFRAGSASATIYGIDIDLSPYEGPSDVRLIEGRSQSQAIIDQIETADLTFIDGSHHYEDVLADATVWAPKTTDLIAFHDCLGQVPVHERVNAAVSEWHAAQPHWTEIEPIDTIRAFRRES